MYRDRTGTEPHIYSERLPLVQGDAGPVSCFSLVATADIAPGSADSGVSRDALSFALVPAGTVAYVSCSPESNGPGWDAHDATAFIIRFGRRWPAGARHQRGDGPMGTTRGRPL